MQFITASGNTNKEIILSEQPVTISFESEDDIFKPLKLSGATVRCWVKDYMFDLYSGEAKGVKCIVTNKEDNSVIWCGYVTPNLYSQDYLQHKFELEVECIDALAVLQYIKYNVTDRQVRSFKDIIDDAIQKTGYDLNLNVVDFCNYKLEDMYISDSNFFDEDGEPMTYKEVLENILQYLNLTMLLYADTIYILDYNLIKNDEDAIKLDESIIYSTPTLSLTEVFNKITVNSSLYNIDLDVDFSSDSKVIDTGMVCSREFKGWKATYRTYSVTNEDEVILEGNKLNKLDYYSSEANQYIDFINGYCVSKTDGTYPIKAKKDWQRTISCRVAKSSISSESAPKIKLRKNLGCLVGGSDSLLCLDFSTMVTYYDYPTPSDNWNSGGKLAGREASITLSIKLGNKYVSKTVDSKYVWIDEYKEFEEIFKLNGNDSEQNKIGRAHV